LDIDALRIVADGVNTLRVRTWVCWRSTLPADIELHQAEFVHIMMEGRIVESGGADLALHLEEQGYDWLREKNGSVAA
jgi:Fe-S cluster assembly ATP-binding protein